ncbi:hypothetical protein CEXT_186621 [Caerostris extrusa]|nr:hypothetical protein CEXT_186621 [Caerostris extrusa]
MGETLLSSTMPTPYKQPFTIENLIGPDLKNGTLVGAHVGMPGQPQMIPQPMFSRSLTTFPQISMASWPPTYTSAMTFNSVMTGVEFPHLFPGAKPPHAATSIFSLPLHHSLPRGIGQVPFTGTLPSLEQYKHTFMPSAFPNLPDHALLGTACINAGISPPLRVDSVSSDISTKSLDVVSDDSSK